MLFCTNCQRGVAAGNAMCTACGQGYAADLACVSCRAVVPRGSAYCPRCSSVVAAEVVSPAHSDRSLATVPFPGRDALAALAPPIMRPTAIAPSYTQNRHGVTAEVHLNPGDVDVMTRMAVMIGELHRLAGDMNRFQAVDDLTRKVIRGCRQLATDLQEDIERRRGPQG